MRLESLILRLLRLALSRGVRQGLSSTGARRAGPPAPRAGGGQAGGGQAGGGKAGGRPGESVPQIGHQMGREMGRRAGQMLRIARRLR